MKNQYSLLQYDETRKSDSNDIEFKNENKIFKEIRF